VRLLKGLIIVTGSPGTGKTFLVKALSEHWRCSTLRQETVLADYLKPDPARDTMIVDEDRIDIGKIESLIRGFLARNGRGCGLLETLYPGFWIRNFHRFVSLVILLRAHPITVCARLSSRPWAKGKVLENCIAEALDTVAEELLDYSELVVELDTTRLSVEELVGQAVQKVSQGDYGVKISWLDIDEGLADVVSYWSILLDLYDYGFRE